jgi:hypothetical protein
MPTEENWNDPNTPLSHIKLQGFYVTQSTRCFEIGNFQFATLLQQALTGDA